jgi:hypothetical protein
MLSAYVYPFRGYRTRIVFDGVTSVKIALCCQVDRHRCPDEAIS